MRLKAVSLTLAVAALIVSGCGSSSSSSSSSAGSSSAAGSSAAATSSSASAPGTSSSKATGTPIHLSLIADMDFPPAGVSLATARPDLAADAAIKAVNAAGGVHGHPLVLSVCDSRGNGNTANACARSAVSGNTVADIGGFNFVGTPVEIMNAGKLAMIGRTPGFNPKEYALPTIFPYFGVGETGMSDAVYAAVKFVHATKIALITSPPANALYFPTGEAEAKALGATVTSTISAMPGSDLTSAVLKARQNGAQAIAAISPIVDQIIVAARQNGVTLPIVSSLQPAQIKSVGSAGNGVYSVEPFQLPSAPDPGLQQMNKELNAYQAGIPQTVFTLPGWLAVHMFADVADKLKVVNRATVLAAFQHLKAQNAYDLIPPYTTTVKFTGLGGMFPSLYNPWMYLQQVENGQLVQRNGGNPFNPFGG
jgi:branched-chain amino acid transport system substrate-binding protein